MRTRPSVVGAGSSVGDSGGDASKALDVAIETRTGGGGKWATERDERRLLDPTSEIGERRLAEEAECMEDMVPRRDTCEAGTAAHCTVTGTSNWTCN